MANSDNFGGVLIDIAGLGVVLVIGYVALRWLMSQTSLGTQSKSGGASLGLGGASSGAGAATGVASNGQQLLNSLEQMVGGSTAGLNPDDSFDSGLDIPDIPTDDSGDFWDAGFDPALTGGGAVNEDQTDDLQPDDSDGDSEDIGD